MVARPGRLQSAYTAGELDRSLFERWELKYFGSGARRMENVQIVPQGGFKLRDGLRDVGFLPTNARRIVPFEASDGSSYDLTFFPDGFKVWGAGGHLIDIPISMPAVRLAAFTTAQQLDTMLVFHEDMAPARIIHTGPLGWTVGVAPLVGIPSHDYGGAYTNGVAAEWELEFTGLDTEASSDGASIFTLTVSQQETFSIPYLASAADLAVAIGAAVLDLPNVLPGVEVTDAGSEGGARIRIKFAGDGNEGDGWAVSGEVLNKTDAAIISSKKVVGVVPGEPLVSAERGWPHCGAFYSQRLLLGGFKSLPNAWMFSKVGDYFNFDQRFVEANGPALVPMDVAGGERIERIVPNRNLLIFTTRAEYWLAERALSKTAAPNHVQSSRYGARRGVAIVENEGAAVFTHSGGNVVGEFRYTDVEGNFVSTDLSLLAPHLTKGVADMAVRRATRSTSGNVLALVEDSGAARLVTMLRDQEVTAFARLTSPGASFKSVAVNGRNEMSFIAQRPFGHRLERLEEGLLLDAAVAFNHGTPFPGVGGIERFNGREVWIVAHEEVFGPLTVSNGFVPLPRPVTSGYVGEWSPPVVQTLPLPRTVGPNTVLKRKARIHTVIVNVLDTTSLAIGTNGKPARNVDLMRYGAFLADMPELQATFTGDVKITGLTGFADDPFVTITQTRPGRLNVRSVTIEAAF